MIGPVLGHLVMLQALGVLTRDPTLGTCPSPRVVVLVVAVVTVGALKFKLRNCNCNCNDWRPEHKVM